MVGGWIGAAAHEILAVPGTYGVASTESRNHVRTVGAEELLGVLCADDRRRPPQTHDRVRT
jgi:hypothetical protein